MSKGDKKNIKVFSPATVANVGCGFDVFAFAIDQPGDEIHLSTKESPGVEIKDILGNVSLPDDVNENTVSVSISAMLDYLNIDVGISITLHKKMPIKSGLGSSAASAVGGVYALNHLLQTKLSNELLLRFAIEGEKIASGDNIHLDNIAACLYGGFVIVRSESPIDIISIPVPAELHCVILHPQLEINTLESRKLLPEKISLTSATRQWGNTAAVISALYESNFDLLKRSITDAIIEPERAKQIPAFHQLKSVAIKAGALGFGISGSGPAVFALSDSLKSAERISQKISDFYHSTQVSFTTYVSKVNKSGPQILQK
jgi:homoserine kinase